MNLLSNEFLDDMSTIPIKKTFYVYQWKNEELYEYLAGINLDARDIKILDFYKARPSFMVHCIKNLTHPEEEISATKTFVVDLESSNINNNKLWLPERDPELALECFIKNKSEKIEKYLDIIEELQVEIKEMSRCKLALQKEDLDLGVD